MQPLPGSPVLGLKEGCRVDSSLLFFCLACSLWKILCQDKPGRAPSTTDPLSSTELQSCTHHSQIHRADFEKGTGRTEAKRSQAEKKVLEFDLELAGVEEGQPQAEGLN